MSRQINVPSLKDKTPEDLARESQIGQYFGQQQRPRVVRKSKTGTRQNPYPRLDGKATQKVSFTASSDFEKRLRVFVAALPPGITRSEWLEKVIADAMDRVERKAG
jgi:hypothetical protein